MNAKWALFTGILLLVGGILLGIFTELHFFQKLLIYTGVGFKLFYIIYQIIIGRYKPGGELIILLMGLILFFTGIYFKHNYSHINYLYLMISGIALKVIYVIIFIAKTR